MPITVNGWLSPEAQPVKVTQNSEGDSGYRGGTRYKSTNKTKQDSVDEEQKRIEQRLQNQPPTNEIDENGYPRVIGMSGRDPLLGTMVDFYLGDKFITGGISLVQKGARYVGNKAKPYRLAHELNRDIVKTEFTNVPVYHGTTYLGNDLRNYGIDDIGLHVTDNIKTANTRLKEALFKRSYPENAHIKEGVFTYTNRTQPIEIFDRGVFNYDDLTLQSWFNPSLRKSLDKVHHISQDLEFPINPPLMRLKDEIVPFKLAGQNYKYVNIYEPSKGYSYLISDAESIPFSKHISTHNKGGKFSFYIKTEKHD